MICINSEAVLQTDEDVEEFIKILYGEVYDDVSEYSVKCIAEFLRDVWQRDIRLTHKVHKNIDADIYPLIFVDISNTADLQAVRFTAMSTKEDYKIKKKQKMQFRQYCLKYFKTMVSLFDRFCGA